MGDEKAVGTSSIERVDDGFHLEMLRDISLAEQAKEKIRTAILENAIKPGERVTIEKIAASLGISRTPVREALKALETDGVVRLLPRRGAIVEGMAREEMSRRYTIRAMLEGYAAELACKAQPGTLGPELMAICDKLDEMTATADTSDPEQVRNLSDLNQQFHGLIRDASNSPTLIRLLEGFRNTLAFTLYYWREPAYQKASMKSHREIAQAFLDRAPARARKLMEKHLMEAGESLMNMERRKKD